MTTRKSYRETLGRFLITLDSWETYLAIVAGLFIGCVWPRLNFTPDSTFLLAILTLYFGFTALIEATKLSVFDRLYNSELGAMIRKNDPKQKDALAMFSAGRYIAVLAALSSIVAYVIVHSADGWKLSDITRMRIESSAVGIAGGLVVWMVGFYLSLKRRQDDFIEDISYVRSLEERKKRAEGG